MCLGSAEPRVTPSLPPGSARPAAAHVTSMTDTNPFNDSIDTRVTNLAVQHFGVPKDKATFTFAREVAALLDVTDEATRLRAINDGLVRSHNALLTALARTEEDAAARVEAAEAREDAARLPGNAVALVRTATERVETAIDAAEHGESVVPLLDVVHDFLTSALDVVEAQARRARDGEAR
jgi:hypothetical protein